MNDDQELENFIKVVFGVDLEPWQVKAFNTIRKNHMGIGFRNKPNLATEILIAEWKKLIKEMEKKMTEKQFKVWGHPQVFERSLTAPTNGWEILEEFPDLESAKKHIDRLSKDDNMWKKIKAYRIEETVMIGKQINVGRDPYIRPNAKPLNRGGV